MKFTLFFVGLFFSLTLHAEETKVTKIEDPSFVTIDRRPDKEIVYSRCFATFFAGRSSYTTAVRALQGDRVCPSPEQVTLDVDKVGGHTVKVTTDGGDTVAEPAHVSEANFEKKAQFKGQEWEFLGVPNKVTTKGKSLSKPSETLTDFVYIAVATANDPEQFVHIVCEDITTLQSCFDSRIDGKKPLAFGNSKSNPHAAVASDLHGGSEVAEKKASESTTLR